MKQAMVTGLIAVFLIHGSPLAWAGGGAAGILEEYRAAGAGPFSVARGQALYQQRFAGDTPQEIRQCTSCHANDPKQSGMHPKTGKPIAPLAPSVEPTRLQDPAHVEKWFQRNCTWTVGRPCTPQEKGDFLTYLLSL